MGTAVRFQLRGRSLGCLAARSCVCAAAESAALQHVGHYLRGWCCVPGFPFPPDLASVRLRELAGRALSAGGC